MPKYTVVVQEWIESERGWGQRPDGVSLHVSRQELESFIANHWEGQPDETPEIYSRPEGDAFDAQVPKKLAMAVAKSKNGVWLPEHETWESYLQANQSKRETTQIYGRKKK